MPADTHNDLEQALQDPQAVYGTPQAVLASELSHADKLAVLRRWETDARELSVASDENMAPEGPAAADEAGMLAEVRRALQELQQEQAGDEPAAPTKHGG